MAPTYSIVIPVFDEAATLAELHRRLCGALDDLDGPAEVILVDDGSSDGSYEIMVDLASRDERLRPLRLSRNFGHQIAITAGIDHARGDAVVVMDADLQDPPEVIVEMAERWRAGAQVVYGRRSDRTGESRVKVATAQAFYRVIRRISEVDLPTDVGDFRLVDRVVVDQLQHMREHARYLRGMVAWVGFQQEAVDYIRDPRYAGTTKFSMSRMLRFATDGILSFSSAPLRVALRLGLVISVVAFGYGVVAVGLKVTGAHTVPGWTSLVVVVAFLGGVQLIVLGVIGEYIARIHEEVKGRPLYVVDPGTGRSRVVSARAHAAALGDDDPPLGSLVGDVQEQRRL